MKHGCEDEITLRRTSRQGAGRPKKAAEPEPPRIPRVARLMALAIKFRDMVHRGEVPNYAEIARLGFVTRARLTQIMNLLNLAPELADNVLLGSNQVGAVPFSESQVRRITSLVLWQDQLDAWERFRDNPGQALSSDSSRGGRDGHCGPDREWRRGNSAQKRKARTR